ncbi:MAG: SURF1 family protein [Acidimicrobiia bacterium]
MKRQLLGWVVVVVIAIVFVRLGFWQISRLHERQASNRQIEANLADSTAPLEEILSQGGDLEYRHVTVVGEYAPRFEVLLRNRSYEGEPGYHVLTPLELTAGTTVLVDRGWVPLGVEGPPVSLAPLEGVVQVTGVIRTSKSAGSGLGPKDPPSGTLTAVFWPDLQRLAGQMPGSLEPVYVELRSQVPAGGDAQPIPASDPVLTNGPHLSYTVQWFAFALIAIVGYGLLTRKRGAADREA